MDGCCGATAASRTSAAIPILVLVHFVLPIAAAFALNWLLCSKLHVYSPSIFAFSPQGAPVAEGAADEPLATDETEAGPSGTETTDEPSVRAQTARD